MILVDANILIYAINEASNHSAKARQWLDGQLNGSGRVGLPWATLLAFLRLATNRHVFLTPLTTERAWQQISQWLANERVWIPAPTQRHAEILGQLVT